MPCKLADTTGGTPRDITQYLVFDSVLNLRGKGASETLVSVRGFRRQSALESDFGASRQATRRGITVERRRYQIANSTQNPHLTRERRSTRPSVGARREDRAVVGSKRSFLRQTGVLLAVAWFAGAFVAAAHAQGPAPDPAPPSTSRPKPEPAPGAPQPPPAARTSTPTVRTQPQAVQPVAPSAPLPPSPAPAPPSAPRVVVRQSPTGPVLRRAPLRTKPHKAERKKSTKAKKDTSGVHKRRLPTARAEVATDSSSRDRMLLIGGLALVVLIVGDTVFLSLSARFLRV
jgi:hypothetical protein